MSDILSLLQSDHFLSLSCFYFPTSSGVPDVFVLAAFLYSPQPPFTEESFLYHPATRGIQSPPYCKWPAFLRSLGGFCGACWTYTLLICRFSCCLLDLETGSGTEASTTPSSLTIFIVFTFIGFGWEDLKISFPWGGKHCKRRFDQWNHPGI